MSAIVRDAWSRACDLLDCPHATHAWPFIQRAYAEPWRRYHTMEHIEEGIALLGTIAEPPGPGVHPHARAAMAWVLHDVVYVPGYEGNEEASADLCTALIGARGTAAADVPAVIRATRTHQAEGYVSGLVIDLDLARLASPDFDRHTRDVFGELAWRGITVDEFAAGRAVWAAGMLAHPRLFSVLRELEAPARANLARTTAARVREVVA